MPVSPPVPVIAPAAIQSRDLWRAWLEAPDLVSAETLHIDCSESAEVTMVGAMLLLAALVERSRRGLESRLSLPKSPVALAQLKMWRIDRALRDALNVPFEDLVDGETRERWAVAPTNLDKFGMHELLPEDLCCVTSHFRASEEWGPTLATKKAKVWQATYISRLLDRHLNGRGRRVSTHLVHEGVMNAIRHPSARLFQMAACTEMEADGGRALRVVMWDDGDSIISTLRRVMSNGAELVPRKSPLLRRDIDLQIRDFSTDDLLANETLSNQDPVSDKATNAELLIASMFPGVTSDLAASSGMAHAEVIAEAKDYALPGMGLHVLVTTALDVFGGRVLIRCANIEMSLERGTPSKIAGDPPHIKAIARETDGTGGAIVGNLIAVSLPIDEVER